MKKKISKYILIIKNMNNIRKTLQIVSKQFTNQSEIKQGILVGFTSTTLFSGSIFSVHSYKIGENSGIIAKNTLKGMVLGATTFVFFPIFVYDIYCLNEFK